MLGQTQTALRPTIPLYKIVTRLSCWCVPPWGSFRPSVGIFESLPWDFFVPCWVGYFCPISMGQPFHTICHTIHVAKSTLVSSFDNGI